MNKAGAPAAKALRRGAEDGALKKEQKKQDRADAADAAETDFEAESSLKNQVVRVANPMSMVNTVTGRHKGDDAAALYFPGAKSSALRKHARVKFEVFRVTSPEDTSDPIKIIFELDLSQRKLQTSNPMNPTLTKRSYRMQDLDIDIWQQEESQTFGIWIVERVTSCLCMHSAVERDYVFANKAERSRFCSLIHSICDVLPASAVPEDTVTPRAESKPVRIFASTWNMGNATPSTNLGEDWIPTDGSVDIFVIGTQESKLGVGDKTGQLGHGAVAWFKTLSGVMGDDYVAVAKRNMFQNYLYVAVKKEHAQAVERVETFQAEQGIASVWGNKGGTAVAFRFNGQKLAFVNCHLAANAEKVMKRIEDVKNIIRDVHFGNYNKVEFVTQYTTFWLGDLNFRTDLDMGAALDYIGKDDLKGLAEYDQLEKEKKKGLFHGFMEGELNFKPTYKFDPIESGEPVPEQREYSDYKSRTPSWTDRVLLRPLDGHDIKLVEYGSSPKVCSSDHDPVYATYDLDAPPVPDSGNYRRFLLILTKLKLSDVVMDDGSRLPDTSEGMSLTVNFPFLDDVQKGVKFKHVIELNEGPDGSLINSNTFKLGPFVTTAEYFRKQHITLRVKDQEERFGTVSLSILDAVDQMKPISVTADITKRSFRRATFSGAIIIKVAGGLEEGVALAEVDADTQKIDADDEGEAAEVDDAEVELELPAMPSPDPDYNSDEEAAGEEDSASLEPEPESEFE